MENKKDKKIIIIGCGHVGITSHMITQLHKEFGEHIVIVSESEAKSKGIKEYFNNLNKEDTLVIDDLSKYLIQPSPIEKLFNNPTSPIDAISGKKRGSKGKKKKW